MSFKLSGRKEKVKVLQRGAVLVLGPLLSWRNKTRRRYYFKLAGVLVYLPLVLFLLFPIQDPPTLFLFSIISFSLINHQRSLSNHAKNLLYFSVRE